jgi:hypothetical protein
MNEMDTNFGFGLYFQTHLCISKCIMGWEMEGYVSPLTPTLILLERSERVNRGKSLGTKTHDSWRILEGGKNGEVGGVRNMSNNASRSLTMII